MLIIRAVFSGGNALKLGVSDCAYDEKGGQTRC